MKIGQTAPRMVTFGLRQRAWWVMRRHVVFTLTELLNTLATGAERDAENNLGKYVRALAKAGILKVEGRAAPENLTSPGRLRYRLVVNEGRKAPVWRAAIHQVYDPNVGTIYDISSEVSDA